MSLKTDFNDGAAGFVTWDGLLLAAQGIGATFVFIWAAMICVKAYKKWGDGQMSGSDVMFIAFRSVLIMMIVLYLLVN